jgi:hypothetical protein
VPGIYPVDLDSDYAVLNPAGGALLQTLAGHTRSVEGALLFTAANSMPTTPPAVLSVLASSPMRISRRW